MFAHTYKVIVHHRGGHPDVRGDLHEHVLSASFHVRDDAFTCAYILCALTSEPNLDRHTAVGRELILLDFDAGSEFSQTESVDRQKILDGPENIEDFTLVHQHVSTSAMGIQEAAAFLKQLTQKRDPGAILNRRSSVRTEKN